MGKNFSIVIVGTGGQGVIRASTVIGWAVLDLDISYKLRTAETHGMAQRGGSVIVHLRFGPTVESPLVNKHSADVIIAFELAEALRYIDYLKKDGILLVNNEVIIPPILFRGQHIKVDPEVCIGCGNCKINCYVNYYYKNSNLLAVIDFPSSKITNGICQILEGCTGCKRCIDICSQNAITLVKEISYPELSEIKNVLLNVSKNSFIIQASKSAIELGDIRMTNTIMIGALLGTNKIPLKEESIKNAIKKLFSSKIVEVNLKALEIGKNLVKNYK
ncbi:MAG: 2-oxoacid:acceptor oxidoreductase family protein [Candidatus Helarchaeota archaeon]